MKFNSILIFFICLLAVSCKKREYAPEFIQLEKEEIFSNSSVDGEPFSLRLEDGYYCYASHKQGTDSIYVFEADLRKFDCSTCPLALKVELSDYKSRLPGASVLVDSALRKGQRKFIPGVKNPQTLYFLAHSNKQIASVLWKTSDGITALDSVAGIEFTQPGIQTVSLTVKTVGNCESMIVNKIFVSDDNIFACGIVNGPVVNNTANFTADAVGGKPPYQYTWNFGDGSVDTYSAPSHTYQWGGSYPVKLIVEDADHHLTESNYLYVTGSDHSSCALNMTLSQGGSRNAFLDGVKIQWTDKSNVIFKSNNIAQQAGSYFEIINSQNYEPNEKGEAGRLLTVRFNVLLTDGNRQIWFKTENTAIAVSYK